MTKNKGNKKEQNKRYREKNKEKIKERNKRYRENNKNKMEAARQRWRNENKEYIKQKNKQYYEADQEAQRERAKQWRLNNPQEYKDSYTKRNNERRKSPRKRLDHAIGNIVWFHLKANGLSKQKKRWEDILGYTIEQLITHLEKQFTTEMNWENYGEYWHVDHKTPKSWFSYDSIEDEAFKKCWALENLQPLTATENCAKGNRYAGRKPAEENKHGQADGKDEQEELRLGYSAICREAEAGGEVGHHR